jgi:hypothetical protein
MSPAKVCARIEKQNPEVCGVRYTTAVPGAAGSAPQTDEEVRKGLEKMRVKQLKNILADRGVQCVGCVEKEDFIKKVIDTKDVPGGGEF